MNKLPVDFLHKLTVTLAFVVIIFFATYHLSENPPTWLDEGVFSQVSINLAHFGIYGLQTAPNHFVSAGFLTTSYPVFYPVALSFATFGVNILSARIVMFAFILLLSCLSYLLISILWPKIKTYSAYTLFLLATFAPLYGHGKNVLGEVPGLTFFLASLITLSLIEKGHRTWQMFAIAGLFVGLSMATKPIYLILALPSAIIVFLISHRKSFAVREKAVFFCCSFLPIIFWLCSHFWPNDSFFTPLLAGNINDASFLSLIKENIRRLFFETQPLYFMLLTVFWLISIYIRKYQKIKIHIVELFAVVFTVLNLLCFLTTRGFYRYFFPGEVLSLIFLPISIFYVYSFLVIKIKFPKMLWQGGLVVLIIFQLWQTSFHSWISEFKESNRSALLSQNLGAIKDKKILFFNVPEAVIFLQSSNYYQYLRFGDPIIRGEENLSLMMKGDFDYLLVDVKFPYTEKISQLYHVKSSFDKYTLYEKSKF